MPQQSLLPDYPPMTGLRVDFEDGSVTFSDAIKVSVRVGHRGNEPTTIWAAEFTGVENDYLETLVTEVTRAWLFSPSWTDVSRAATRVLRDARRHRRKHDRA